MLLPLFYSAPIGDCVGVLHSEFRQARPRSSLVYAWAGHGAGISLVLFSRPSFLSLRHVKLGQRKR